MGLGRFRFALRLRFLIILKKPTKSHALNLQSLKLLRRVMRDVRRLSHTMKTKILTLFVLASFALAQSPSPVAVQRADALVTETIPHFSLKNATFQEALDSVRLAWNERHPDEPFPIGLTAFLTPQGYRAEYPAHITLDLKDVPYIEALRYIADLSGRGFRVRQGLPQFEHVTWIEEGWVTRIHEITPVVLTGLKLRSDSSVDDIRQALAGLGVTLEDWMKPILIAGGSHLGLTSYNSQQEQIAGIITLLGNGYKISK